MLALAENQAYVSEIKGIDKNKTPKLNDCFLLRPCKDKDLKIRKKASVKITSGIRWVNFGKIK